MFNLFTSLNNFNYYGNPIVWVAVVILVVMYGFVLRRHQILINLMAIYIGLLASSWLSSSTLMYNWLKGLGWQLSEVSWLAFVLFWLAGVLVLWSARLIKKVDYERRFIWRWLQAVFNGVVQSGLVISFILNFSSAGWRVYFSEWQLKLLLGSNAQLSWFILSLAGVLLMRVKKRGPGRPSL